MNSIIAVVYILIGGIAGAFQARVLGNVETKVGVMGNMFLNFFFGFIFCLIIISVYSLVQYQNLIRVYQEIPWGRIKAFETTAGLFGIVIVTSIGFATPRIGVSGTIFLFIFSQIILGVIIDHFGLMGGEAFPVTPVKVISILIMGLGVYLFFR